MMEIAYFGELFPFDIVIDVILHRLHEDAGLPWLEMGLKLFVRAGTRRACSARGVLLTCLGFAHGGKLGACGDIIDGNCAHLFEAKFLGE